MSRAWAAPAAHYDARQVRVSDAWQIWISTRDPERDLASPIVRQMPHRRPILRVVLTSEEFAAVLAVLNARR